MMNIYWIIRKPAILAGIALLIIAFLMLVRDFVKGKERRASAISMVLVLVLVALAYNMI